MLDFETYLAYIHQSDFAGICRNWTSFDVFALITNSLLKKMNIFNKLIVAAIPAVPRPIVRYFANRYIAGDRLEDAVRAVKQLNAEGIMATMDVLGEDIHQREEATQATEKIIEVIQAIAAEHLDANVSIKLTQLGLKLDKNFCLDNVRTIVSKSKSIDNFVRIDMEDSTCTDDTIWVYRQIRKEFPNSGIVLQARLRRTEADALSMIQDGLNNFRLCKGIYIEPKEIAFTEHDAINKNFTQVLDAMLRQKAYVGIGTHDDDLIDAACKLIDQYKLKKNEYEFQMLLGVRPELRHALHRKGHRVRIYVPFGKHWYQYSIRRFKENPQIAGYVFKSLFTRDKSL